MTDILMIYITCPDRDVAQTIARTLVEEKLIACANILNGVTSIYKWQGKVEESSECLLLAKTVRHRWAEIKKRVLEIHPYENPCLIAYKAAEVGSAFGAWIRVTI